MITLNNNELLKCLEFTRYAISNEETRYYLNGIYFETNAMIATDGQRLHKITFKATGKLDKNFIMHKDTVKTLIQNLKAFKKLKFDVTISNDSVVSENFNLTFKEIDGAFPDYNRVIPEIKKEQAIGCFHAAYLEDCGKAFKGLDKNASITMKREGTDNPCIIKAFEAPEAFIILMPKRV
jgi:DNA polymerase III sliding clamp (beta) subunit (PCNA family)